MAQFEGFNDAPWEGMKYVQSLWNDIFTPKLLVEKKTENILSYPTFAKLIVLSFLE